MAPTSKRTANDKVEKMEAKVSKIEEVEAPEVTLFREYLRIKSVQPDPDYDSCLVFLRKQAERLGLEHHTTELVKGKISKTSSNHNFADFQCFDKFFPRFQFFQSNHKFVYFLCFDEFFPSISIFPVKSQVCLFLAF